MKPKEKNKDRGPQTTLAFYIKLYCQRKGSTKTKYHNNLIEATKSWLSLNETEKQQFHAKFKECEDKYKSIFFSQLQNAETFMKLKDSSIREANTTDSNLNNQNNEDETEKLVSEAETEQIEQLETIEESIFNNATIEIPILESQELPEHEQAEKEIDVVDTPIESQDTQSQPILIEPLPPAIKTGQQLFCMLNIMDDNTWASLPTFEKNRYSRAVSIMKKDYISKYKEYLVSLTPKELFDHYNKTI